jgi:D-citramalate synthase
LTSDKKLKIALKLDELGVNVIEAGFAAASEGEIGSIRRIVKQGLNAEICSMARAVQADIDAVLKSEAQSVHLVIPSSSIHLEHKLKKTENEVLKTSVDCVQYAKDHGLIVELSAEDSTRADVEFLRRMFSSGISVGADRICACDTVGVLTPERAHSFFKKLNSSFNVPISTHCHNDFGLATANTIASLQAGAIQAHTTINGLGERGGNASLEEVVMTLYSLYRVKTKIRTKQLYSASRLVSHLTGLPVPLNKAIVGENAFTHEAGIHTHAILSYPLTYEPISPEIVGATRKFHAGKHSGTHGIKATLNDIGLYPTKTQLKEVFDRVKKIGDRGKTITDADLYAIALSVMGLPKTQAIKIEELTVITGNKVTPTASVKVNINGNSLIEAGTGVGPVDAAINAIRKALSQTADIKLEQYHVKAITGGSDAVVEVVVHLRRDEKVVTATGVHGDIVTASVDAMLSGMNMLLSKHNKRKI